MDVGTVIGVVVALGSLIVALLTYLHRRGTKRLEYVVLTNTSLLPRRLHSELNVSYRSQQMFDPSLTIIRVVSTGDTAIRLDDFETPLSFALDGAREVVSAEWTSTRPTDFRPGLRIEGARVYMEPAVFNAGDLLQLQVLTSGRPREVRMEGRVADLELERRASLPYPPGSGVEGEMVGFDRLMWFVFTPGLLIGIGALSALEAQSASARTASIIATAIIAGVLYPAQVRYLIKRRRRWRAAPH